MNAPSPSRRPARVPRVLFALVRPFQRFFRTQAASGIFLMVTAAVAMLWANSPWHHGYHDLFHTRLHVELGGRGLAWTVHHWINDALMTFFFFVVGMEIKRELVKGELRTLSRAALPAIAALGGMVVPAAIYFAIARGTEAQPGWGIPMATDIAFALGCMALIRTRVPASLFVFLTALAIFDDLGAILVIAVFYGGAIDVVALGAAGALTLTLVALSRGGVQRALPYALLGVALWMALLKSGLHATLAGVILGLTIPAEAPRTSGDVLDDLDAALDSLRRAVRTQGTDNTALAAIERHLESVQAPLDRFVHGLHGAVAFGVVPVFALANAGIALSSGASLTSPASMGSMLGLVIGKPVGVFGATWLAVRLGLAPKPTGATWREVLGVAMLSGIGFTMSLFVDALAFGGNLPLEDGAKMGVLVGSVVSAVAGMAFLRVVGRVRAATAEESDTPVLIDLRRFAPGFRVEPWTTRGTLVGRTLAEAQLRAAYGVSVLGVWLPASGDDPLKRTLKPVGAEFVLTEGDTLLLVAEDEAMERFLSSAAGGDEHGALSGTDGPLEGHHEGLQGPSVA